MFSERLKKSRKSAGLTQEELATRIGVERSSVGKYESTSTIPSPDVLARISKELNVTTDYLLTGKNTNASPQDFNNIFPLKTKKLPLLGDIACGEPIFADEQRGEYVITEEGINADFCLRAKGDSMIGARINDGDIVFVQSCSTVDNGEIAAVIIDNEATLKRVYYYPEQNKLVLSAENPKYPPFVYIDRELEYVRIIGRAVAFQSIII